MVAERRRLAAEKQEFEKKQGEFSEWQKSRADFKRNPAKHLQNELGEKWYDTLTQVQLTGASTPDLILSEAEDREKRILATIEEREQKMRKEMEDFKSQQDEAEKQAYVQSAIAHVKGDAEKYFWTNEFEEFNAVPSEIERHFIATTVQRPDGSYEPGELLTPAQAAEAVEKRIVDLVAKAKAAEARREAAKAPKPLPSEKRNEVPHRRTLSTNLTATSEDTQPAAITDAERKKRAFAAWDEVLASRRQH